MEKMISMFPVLSFETGFGMTAIQFSIDNFSKRR